MPKMIWCGNTNGYTQEELAIKNRRSKGIWKVIGFVLLIIIVFNILLVVVNTANLVDKRKLME